jgi:phosphoserine phosphatase
MPAPTQTLILHAAAAGPTPDRALLQTILALCGGADARLQTLDHPQWRERAYRIPAARKPVPDSEQAQQLQQCCDQAALDLAWLETRSLESPSLNDFGLLAMDMDSTLITIECIDEIADMQGLKPQVAAITEAAMRGELDFAQSLRQRVALLEGLPEQALQSVYDSRLQLSAGAQTLLDAAHTAGLHTLLVSGGFNFFTDRLQQRLGLRQTLANTLEVSQGKLTGRVLGDIVDARAKAACVRNAAQRLGLQPAQIISMGDGANDLAMMAESGVSIAFHAKPAVRAQARHAFNHAGLDGVLALFPPQGMHYVDMQ